MNVKHYERGFLNLGEGMAAYSSSVDYEPSDDHRGSVSAFFNISDCSRQICLDFCIYDKDDLANVQHKLAIIQQKLAEFNVELTKAASLWAMENKKYEERKSNE